jgi:hypothetical protein
MPLIAPGLRDDQPEVRVDHPLLGLEVTALDPLGELDLLSRREQGVDPGPAQEQLERLGGAKGARLGDLQAVAGMRGAPPVLAAVALGRMSPKDPLGLVYIGFVIATNAGGAIAMGVMTLQFCLRCVDKVRCTSNYSIVRCPSNLV